MTKSKKPRCVGKVARMEEMGCASKVLVGRPERRDHLEENGRIILQRIFEKWNWAWTRLIWLRIGTVQVA